MIENLKEPKNPIPTIIVGWVFYIGGCFVLLNWSLPLVAQIIGFIDLAMSGLTLIRLSLTKLIYAVICIVLVLGYSGFYLKHRGWDSRDKLKPAAYAPAVIADILFVGTVHAWRFR